MHGDVFSQAMSQPSMQQVNTYLVEQFRGEVETVSKKGRIPTHHLVARNGGRRCKYLSLTRGFSRVEQALEEGGVRDRVGQDHLGVCVCTGRVVSFDTINDDDAERAMTAVSRLVSDSALRGMKSNLAKN